MAHGIPPYGMPPQQVPHGMPLPQGMPPYGVPPQEWIYYQQRLVAAVEAIRRNTTVLVWVLAIIPAVLLVLAFLGSFLGATL
jgi:hypothetical protein